MEDAPGSCKHNRGQVASWESHHLATVRNQYESLGVLMTGKAHIASPVVRNLGR